MSWALRRLAMLCQSCKTEMKDDDEPLFCADCLVIIDGFWKLGFTRATNTLGFLGKLILPNDLQTKGLE